VVAPQTTVLSSRVPAVSGVFFSSVSSSANLPMVHLSTLDLSSPSATPARTGRWPEVVPVAVGLVAVALAGNAGDEVEDDASAGGVAHLGGATR
jgi:hypothetical protein